MELSAYLTGMLPEFILLAGACLVLLAGMGKVRESGPGIQGLLALLVLVAALMAACWCGDPSNRQAPPGIVLGSLLYYVRLAALLTGIPIVLCNLHLPVAQERSEYFALILFSILGLHVTAAANDLVVLFFAIELVSIPTYIIIALSRENKRASEAAVKYFFLGALAAGLMVYGFSFLYGALGGHTTLIGDAGQQTLSSVAAASDALSTYALIGLVLALAGCFFKVAAVPFHAYVADVYQGAASPVTGMLGFLPKFAGFIAAIKLLSIFNWQVPDKIMWLLWILAALTMTVGNTLALLQNNVKRILAYSSIAHSGYMLIGLIVGPSLVGDQGPMRDGLAALLFYMAIYGVMNLGAFAVLGALGSKREDAETLTDIQGLSATYPGLALAMAVCCFSLMGFPPTAGMLGKVYIFSSAFAVGDSHPFGYPLIILAVIGVLNSAVGAAYYLRIIGACYGRKPETEIARSGGAPIRWGIALCGLTMILAFLWPTGITQGARQAAAEIRNTPAIEQVAEAGATATSLSRKTNYSVANPSVAPNTENLPK